MALVGPPDVLGDDGRLPRRRWMLGNGHPGWGDAQEGRARCGLVGVLVALLPDVGDEKLRPNTVWLWLGSTRCMAMLAGCCTYLRKVSHLWCVRGFHFVADPARSIIPEFVPDHTSVSMGYLQRAHPDCSRCAAAARILAPEPPQFPTWASLADQTDSD